MKRVALTVLLLALMLFLFYDWKTSIPTTGPCPDNDKKHHYSYSDNKCPTLRSGIVEGRPIVIWFSDIAENYPDTITAIATLLLVFVTGGLVYIARDQSKTTRAQLRAYITINTGNVGSAEINGSISDPLPMISVGKRPISVLQFVNSGQTPAYDMQFSGEIEMVNWPIDPSILKKIDFTGHGSKEILGPHGTREKFDIPHKSLKPLTSDDIEAITNGSRAIVIHGAVKYRDAFDKTRTTRYRYFMGGPIGLRGTRLSAHDEGNEAD